MGPDGSVLLLDGGWLHHGIGGDEAPRGLWAAQPPLSRNPRVGRAFKTHFILEYLAQPEIAAQGPPRAPEVRAVARSGTECLLWEARTSRLARLSPSDVYGELLAYYPCGRCLLADSTRFERVLGEIDPEDDVPVDLLSHISPIRTGTMSCSTENTNSDQSWSRREALELYRIRVATRLVLKYNIRGGGDHHLGPQVLLAVATRCPL